MYYAVFYSTDGTIHLWPNETKEGCEQKLLDILKDYRVYERCDRTTIIKRELNGDYVFGSPKSLNIKDKFDRLARKGEI